MPDPLHAPTGAPFHVILYEPEIPANTGNIIRLVANTGAHLHLIEPLGFQLDHKKLKRAGLDYHEWANVKCYPNLNHCIEAIAPGRIFPCSTKGKMHHTQPQYLANDAFLFGPETRGLPETILSKYIDNVIRIPMVAASRSLNLSNAVAIVLLEGWRQVGFQ